MKIITNKNLLLNGINICQKAVPSKTTLPILEGIMIEAKNGKLKLIGTDLEVGIETTINVDVIVPGKTVISSKILGEIVRKLPDSDIELELKDNNVVYIKCENSHFKINGMTADEFPDLPEVKKENGLVITQNKFKEMIKQTIFSVSSDEIRPILTGVLFEVAGDKISMVALDGFRMAVKNCSVINDSSFKSVIPGKSLAEIGKILDDTEEPVNIYFSKNQIIVQVQDTIVISRLLEGEFINYKQIIPSDYKIKVTVPTSHLIESCERAALFARDSSNNMIKFEINDDVMSIKSNSQNGDVQEELKVNKQGEDIEIAFNAKYFMDVLKVIESEEVTIEFTTNISPSILRPLDDNGYLYLILPTRFKK
ncbi:DNA polymerase III subunit beta [Clostridium sp.]|jgi:DNA polymerase-3 subunit beta|uniref:DNA polymerase III subunit beta n=1 Tax=Clostridium sp. TaxID=1506 RepID=UPI00258D87D6|nr:DNA polymerase III subunit beta [Clostridium sp.]MDF2505591.1 polymerase subunit beta [Clostridium sp.]